MSEHRILHVESPASIGLDTGRLCIRAEGRPPWFGSVENVAALSLADPAIRVSSQALSALAERGAVVLLADDRHLPVALVQPVRASSLVAGRIRLQAEWLAAHPAHADELWADIVSAKLAMQADALKRRGLNGHLRLSRLAGRVTPGDASNVEAQAARHYWKCFFPSGFRRAKRDAADHLNAKLNYGYAVLRALVARHLALAGLEPSLGMHHRGATNPFNLADDLMEPLRPIVDGIVRDELMEEGPLDREARRALLGVMEHSVRLDDGREYRLHAALESIVQSLVRAMERPGRARLVLPEACGDAAE